MNCKLRKGLLEMPPEEPVELRWPYVTDMIEEVLREKFLETKECEYGIS